MKKNKRLFIFLLAIFLLGIFYLIKMSDKRISMPVEFLNTKVEHKNIGESMFSEYGSKIVDIGKFGVAHSSSALQLNKDNIFLVWFAGSKEGAKDVNIYGYNICISDVCKNSENNTHIVITRKELSKELGMLISRIGNPVLFRLNKKQIGMFVVVVGIGGWSVSSIAVLLSDNNGKSWHSIRKIVNSNFYNISTLVKYPPIWLVDSKKRKYMLLPAYHELAQKHLELLVLDKNFIVVKKIIPNFNKAIQPTLAIFDNRVFIAMRNSSKEDIKFMKTMWLDNNLNLSKPTITKTKNPNSALDIIKINNDEMIMVFNNHFLRRNNLSIAYSNNKGKDWDSIYVLEQAKVKFMDFSYPYMLFDGSRYHIFYSYKKKTIKHVWFSKEWIRNKIKLSSTNKPEVSQ